MWVFWCLVEAYSRFFFFSLFGKVMNWCIIYCRVNIFFWAFARRFHCACRGVEWKDVHLPSRYVFLPLCFIFKSCNALSWVELPLDVLCLLNPLRSYVLVIIGMWYEQNSFYLFVYSCILLDKKEKTRCWRAYKIYGLWGLW